MSGSVITAILRDMTCDSAVNWNLRSERRMKEILITVRTSRHRFKEVTLRAATLRPSPSTTQYYTFLIAFRHVTVAFVLDMRE